MVFQLVTGCWVLWLCAWYPLQRSWEYLVNAFAALDYDGTPLGAFVEQNDAWVDAQVAANPADSYWYVTGCSGHPVMTQWSGPVLLGLSPFRVAHHTCLGRGCARQVPCGAY